METPSVIEGRRASFAQGWRLPFALVLTASGLVLASSWSSETIYAAWDGKLASGRGPVQWLLAAWTEAEFYTSALAGAGLLSGACLAIWAERTRKSWRGFGLACGSGLWPWTVASSVLGLVLSNVAWGWTLADTGLWQPTFVPVVSVAPSLVLVYGGNLRSVLTGAILSALLVAPVSIGATQFVCRPLGLPLVVGVTGGMALGGVAAFALCRLLPWLPSRLPQTSPAAISHDDHALPWMIRRMLADFSEAQFFGNEWASAGLIFGVLIAVHLTPGVPAYGSGLLPQVLGAQALAGAVGMVFWRRMWVRRGFYPTFVPVVSVAPTAVLVFGGTFTSVLGGAVLGALMGPPLAATISDRLPEDFHPFIGNVASMAMTTAIIIPLLGFLHTPR